MNTNSHNQPPTLGEIIEKSKMGGAKSIVVGLVIIFLFIGIAYTGVHNYNLFGHGLQGDQAVFALIPVVLLEGSILLTLAGSFVWFSGGSQKIFASAFGWMLFLIVAANTVVDSMMNSRDTLPSWLAVYSQFFMFATPVGVMAAWKLILDLDPSKKKLDQQKSIEHALEEAKFAHIQRAMLSEANREALTSFGDQFGEAMAAHIRNSAPQISRTGVIDGESKPIMKMSKDTPEDVGRVLNNWKADAAKRDVETFTVHQLAKATPTEYQKQVQDFLAKTLGEIKPDQTLTRAQILAKTPANLHQMANWVMDRASMDGMEPEPIPVPA